MSFIKTIANTIKLHANIINNRLLRSTLFLMVSSILVDRPPQVSDHLPALPHTLILISKDKDTITMISKQQ